MRNAGALTGQRTRPKGLEFGVTAHRTGLLQTHRRRAVGFRTVDLRGGDADQQSAPLPAAAELSKLTTALVAAAHASAQVTRSQPVAAAACVRQTSASRSALLGEVGPGLGARATDDEHRQH